MAPAPSPITGMRPNDPLDPKGTVGLTLFAPQRVYANNPPRYIQATMFTALFALFYVLASVLPADGFVGFDWIHFFAEAQLPPFYPPWTEAIVKQLTWPALVGLSLASVAFASYRRASSALSMSCALITLPLFWTVFLGQIDGLVVLGILGLPILAPLALMKPQVSIFSFLARKSYLAALAITLGISFLVWGFWPPTMFSVWTVHAEVRYANDIALGLIGLTIAAPLLWFSRGDIDMLMLAGTFCTPYLLPYNLVVVVPAVARLAPRAAAAASLLSWLPLASNWIGPIGWWTGWLFVGWVWTNLAIKRYPRLGAYLSRRPFSSRSS